MLVTIHRGIVGNNSHWQIDGAYVPPKKNSAASASSDKDNINQKEEKCLFKFSISLSYVVHRSAICPIFPPQQLSPQFFLNPYFCIFCVYLCTHLIHRTYFFCKSTEYRSNGLAWLPLRDVLRCHHSCKKYVRPDVAPTRSIKPTLTPQVWCFF